jgi:hypothetical protein
VQHSAAFSIWVIDPRVGWCFLPESRNTRLQRLLPSMTETSAILFRKPAAFAMIAAVALALPAALANADQANTHETLKSPSEFMSISNVADRSQAIFGEIGKLLTHPRCMNCHPAGDHPLQGADKHEHGLPR